MIIQYLNRPVREKPKSGVQFLKDPKCLITAMGAIYSLYSGRLVIANISFIRILRVETELDCAKDNLIFYSCTWLFYRNYLH